MPTGCCTQKHEHEIGAYVDAHRNSMDSTQSDGAVLLFYVVPAVSAPNVPTTHVTKVIGMPDNKWSSFSLRMLQSYRAADDHIAYLESELEELREIAEADSEVRFVLVSAVAAEGSSTSELMMLGLGTISYGDEQLARALEVREGVGGACKAGGTLEQCDLNSVLPVGFEIPTNCYKQGSHAPSGNQHILSKP